MIYKYIIWFVFCLICITRCIGTTTKQNVLFIVVDDLRPTLGCYGDRLMITPNIDGLARKSVLFNNAYVQQALCGPSRTSFLTGRRPDTTHLYDLYSYWRKAAGNFTTLPQHFKENGYFTQSVGKVFHPDIASNYTDDYPYSWSVPAYHPPTQKYKQAKVCPGPQGNVYRDVVCPVTVTDQPGGSLPDIQSREFAVNFLKERSANHSQPFFLAVGFHKPHLPLKYPKEYLKLFPLEKIHMAAHNTYPLRLPLVAWNPWTDIRMRDDIQALNLSFPFGPVTGHYQRLMRQSYYAATSYMDTQVGLLLHALQKYGFSNNTIISLVGDHGWSLGEHQEWSKYSNFDVAVRVPLIIHVPGLTDRGTDDTFQYTDPFKTLDKESSSRDGYEMADNRYKTIEEFTQWEELGRSRGDYKVSNDLVELVDLFPTLSSLAGLAVPKTCPLHSSEVKFCCEGSSLVGLIKNTSGLPLIERSVMRSSDWKRAVFSQYPRPSVEPQENSDKPHLHDIRIMGYSMRTQQYCYTEWVDFNPRTFSMNWSHIYATELYRRTDDPDEVNNLAYFTRFVDLKAHLSKILHAGWRNVLPS